MSEKYNRLSLEKSPYLQQHAAHPVEWYPWGEEAFERAKKEGKPVFLSIGYSTCHWCHVMAHESFEDAETAAVLNKDFISVKVDREERPDIDAIYMRVCQMLTGAGGWPLSVFLDAEKRPFFAGTYYPKQDTRGMISFKGLLRNISELWETNPAEIAASAAEITALIQREKTCGGRKVEDLPEKALEALSAAFDGEYGGFGFSPKFASPHTLLFLMKHYEDTKNGHSLLMAEKTLEHMYRGGIFDHIGGGFSRYSTDNKWLVPHFEKMLYDNAMLALAYTRAYELTKKELYKFVAEETLAFLEREMSSPEGGFYSAFDADSEGEEGKFYLWTRAEVEAAAGDEFCALYGVTEKGNFEGKNILNLIGAESLNIPPHIAEGRKKLYALREKRVKPFLDKKISAANSGMAVAAFAFAGKVFGEKKYVDRAEKAFGFLEKKLIKEGKPVSSYIDGTPLSGAFCEDYAYMIFGALHLFAATEDRKYLNFAAARQKRFDAEFWDEEGGGYFLYAAESERLIARPKEAADNAYPSGNSAAVFNLLRMAEFTGDLSYKKRAERAMSAFAGQMESYPAAHTFWALTALLSRGAVHNYCDMYGNCGSVT